VTKEYSVTEVDLDIGGMTCTSCAMSIEKKLNKLPGVIATVNYATEKAHVVLPQGVSIDRAIEAVAETGYTASLPVVDEWGTAAGDDRELRSLRQRLIICTILTIPVVLMAMVPALQFDYWQWISLVLATPVVTWGAWPFHRATWANLRHGAVTMDTLISLGVIAAYVWSLYALFFGGAGMVGMTMDFAWLPSESGNVEIYFEVASAVTVFILLGRYLEVRAKARSGAALRALLTLGAKDVAVLRNGTETRILVSELAVGDNFIVRPGEKIATDGVVVEGESAVDNSLLTGEPVPIDVGPGDLVIGATINAGGRLIVRATEVGAQTQLARIARMVEQAQTGKAPVQRLADRVATIFVPIVIGLSLLTLAGWLLTGHSATAAFTAAVAVLIIACPCALGLATPTALLVGTGRAAQLGIVIKGPQILESTRRIDTFVLDKTGTITTGRMALIDVIPLGMHAPDEVLRLAGALEAASEHPVGRAIAMAAGESLPPVEGFASVRGLGVSGVVERHSVAAGRPSWLADQWSALFDAKALTAMHVHEDLGRTVIGIAIDGESAGFAIVSDTVKPESARAIAGLRALGLRPVLLTGDNPRAAAAVAAEVGIEEVIAEVLPEQKAETIAGLQCVGDVVAMAGDGVNDAAALALADLGLAMGTGTDVAIEAADITLVRGDLMGAVDAIRLSRQTLRIIKGNLFWAFAYNIAAIPLAMAGLLNPMVAGAAMAFSSVFVVTNSLRLRRFRSVALA
jgi:Cu+-exporting ATPase